VLAIQGEGSRYGRVCLAGANHAAMACLGGGMLLLVVGLGIVVTNYRRRATTVADDLDSLKG